MPFGLKQAPACFQRLMNQILEAKLYEGLIVYLDDIIFWANSLEELRSNMLWAIQQLADVGLKLNGEKCIFLTRKLEILGHYVKEGYLLPQTEKLPWLKLECKNISEVRTLVGALSYFRKFVPHFADRMRPVLDLLKKVKFEWTEV